MFLAPKLIDATPCRRSQLTFKFELFTVDASVSGSDEIFLPLMWQLSYPSASVGQGFAQFFHPDPLDSLIGASPAVQHSFISGNKFFL